MAQVKSTKKKQESLPAVGKETGSTVFGMAVVEISGKQHLVAEGYEVIAEVALESEPKMKLDKVLMFFDGQDFSFGRPYVSGAYVEAERLQTYKGEKIDVVKFKAKSRYSKKIGYRPTLSKLKINKISGGNHGS